MNDDLIRREDAINALNGQVTLEMRWPNRRVIKTMDKYLNVVIDRIRALPAVRMERTEGKWIYGENEYGIDGYHCDKCGFFVPWNYKHELIDFIKGYHFCPSCGAYMR